MYLFWVSWAVALLLNKAKQKIPVISNVLLQDLGREFEDIYKFSKKNDYGQLFVFFYILRQIVLSCFEHAYRCINKKDTKMLFCLNI